MSKEPTLTDSRKPGFYFVRVEGLSDYFPAEYLGSKWVVSDQDGHPEFLKDAHFEDIDERRIERGQPDELSKRTARSSYHLTPEL